MGFCFGWRENTNPTKPSPDRPPLERRKLRRKKLGIKSN